MTKKSEILLVYRTKIYLLFWRLKYYNMYRNKLYQTLKITTGCFQKMNFCQPANQSALSVDKTA